MMMDGRYETDGTYLAPRRSYTLQPGAASDTDALPRGKQSVDRLGFSAVCRS